LQAIKNGQEFAFLPKGEALRTTAYKQFD